jgi:hypothetical protein
MPRNVFSVDDEKIKALREERESQETQQEKEARELKNSDLKGVPHKTTTFKLPVAYSEALNKRAKLNHTSVSFQLRQALEALVVDANGVSRTEPKKPKEEWYTSDTLNKSKFLVATMDEQNAAVTKQPMVRVLGDIQRKRIPFDDNTPNQVGALELTTIKASLPVPLLKEIYTLAEYFQMSLLDVVTQALERFIYSTTSKSMPSQNSELLQFHAERQQRLDETTDRKLANRQARKGVATNE